MNLNELREFLDINSSVENGVDRTPEELERWCDFHHQKSPLAVAKLIEAAEMLRSGKDTLLFVIDEEASTELMNKWISKVANFLSEFEEVQDDPNQI